MIRFLFRLLSMLALAVATIMAVIDATRTIAASGWLATPFGESWQAVSPATLEQARSAFETLLPGAWAMVEATILAVPGFVVFAILALVFYVIGHRAERREAWTGRSW